MKYPVILNGDHAEFELAHEGDDPKDRPDWPLPSFDARDWAQAFLKINPNCGVDEGALIGWFANALMRGYDEASPAERKGVDWCCCGGVETRCLGG